MADTIMTDIASDRFPRETTVRTVKMGLYGGIVLGLGQDFLTYARGGRLRYVDFVLGKSNDSQPLDNAKTRELPTTTKT